MCSRIYAGYHRIVTMLDQDAEMPEYVMTLSQGGARMGRDQPTQGDRWRSVLKGVWQQRNLMEFSTQVINYKAIWSLPGNSCKTGKTFARSWSLGSLGAQAIEGEEYQASLVFQLWPLPAWPFCIKRTMSNAVNVQGPMPYFLPRGVWTLCSGLIEIRGSLSTADLIWTQCLSLGAMFPCWALDDVGFFSSCFWWGRESMCCGWGTFEMVICVRALKARSKHSADGDGNWSIQFWHWQRRRRIRTLFIIDQFLAINKGILTCVL